MLRMVQDVWNRVIANPGLTALGVLPIAAVFVIIPSVFPWRYGSEDFFVGVLIEGHGMLMDIVVIGIIVGTLGVAGERRREIRRYEEEIDDFRGWKSDEAMRRNSGNVRRLSRRRVDGLRLEDCYLRQAMLGDINLRSANGFGVDLQKAVVPGADLRNADLRRADLRHCDLSGASLGMANLVGADLQHANLSEANLERTILIDADLERANLRAARGLTVQQLSWVKTLRNAELDQHLKAELEMKYPGLIK